jgi:hypothetical protein
VDTLVKYLADSLQRYENDYGNSLCPVQNQPDQSFMGDHTLFQPVTVHEFRMFGTTILSALKTPSESTAASCSQLLSTPTGLQVLNPKTSESVPTPTTEQQTPTRASPTTTNPGATYCPTNNNLEQAAVSLANCDRDSSASRTSACNLSIPLAGVCIPDLPRSRGGWHIALRQWYNIDPKTGYALKHWPDAWFKDSMREKTAAKRSQRALIAHEYER